MKQYFGFILKYRILIGYSGERSHWTPTKSESICGQGRKPVEGSLLPHLALGCSECERWADASRGRRADRERQRGTAPRGKVPSVDNLNWADGRWDWKWRPPKEMTRKRPEGCDSFAPDRTPPWVVENQRGRKEGNSLCNIALERKRDFSWLGKRGAQPVHSTPLWELPPVRRHWRWDGRHKAVLFP